MSKHCIIPVILLLLTAGLGGCKKTPQTADALQAAPFSGDSAYRYIAEQVAFGPRVPGTTAHYECARYLRGQLERFGATVETQQGQMPDYRGEMQPVVNLIARFDGNRPGILLCAHWDSRPWADQEEEYADRMRPVTGANDGASGTGVLLEIARQLGMREKTGPAVDIVLFDCEDMGTPDFYTGRQREDTWCLGSQLWAKSVRDSKQYRYGILLDMVGSPEAVFPKEYHSMEFAAQYTERVWRTARRLGYSTLFRDEVCYPITDDHYYINTLAGIPCIDIIHYDPHSSTGFGHYWHTLHDDMSAVSPATPEAVGKVVLTTILN
ncbi:MAG: M28 family peptidase [Paludibacteraceae bacterium]|nr:M28 family peptidase [Paludibacteraceae bacterium]